MGYLIRLIKIVAILQTESKYKSSSLYLVSSRNPIG